jgi:spoIIIJ-associated protein
MEEHDMTDQTDAPAESESTPVEAADQAILENAASESGDEAADDGGDDAGDAAGESAGESVEESVEESADDVVDAATEVTPGDRLKELETEGDIAADYLEELLDIADLDGDLDMDVEGDRAAVSIVGEGLNPLVGADGQVLESLQELTRLAVYRETGERSRLMLDIGGYRAEVRKNLVLLAEEAVEDVRDSGEAVKLAPMSPFERKVVHDAVAAAGLRSESEGVEPTRCVVIHPVG